MLKADDIKGNQTAIQVQISVRLHDGTLGEMDDESEKSGTV